MYHLELSISREKWVFVTEPRSSEPLNNSFKNIQLIKSITLADNNIEITWLNVPVEVYWVGFIH